ncbi:MAG: FmdE family protein [Syntrophobacteraceae bacterium]|nr:FmdE family protein [Syntrophobacteraceae bacterium]
MNEDFKALLGEAVRFHGHLCGGQVIGVRMAMAGLRELGIKEPRGKEGRDLVIFVEIDRCPVDAIIAVTGRTPGRRSIKMMDYGKQAATFVDAGASRAVRVSVKTGCFEKAALIARTLAGFQDEQQALYEALAAMDEEELLSIRRVSVAIEPRDLPGEALQTVVCQKCGETVKDMRQVGGNGLILCKPCALGLCYYKEIPSETDA